MFKRVYTKNTYRWHSGFVVNYSMLKSEIFLISLAIFCQCFSYADWYFIKTIFDVVDAKHAHLVIDDFLPYWFLIYFIGKLAGTYCFGKMTQSLILFQNYAFYLVCIFSSSFFSFNRFGKGARFLFVLSNALLCLFSNFLTFLCFDNSFCYVSF